MRTVLTCIVVLTACSAPPRLIPDRVAVADSREVLEVQRLPPRALVHARRTLGAREIEVFIGDQPAEVVEIGVTSVRFRAMRLLPVGEIAVRLQSSSGYQTTLELDVVGGGVDGGVDSDVEDAGDDASDAGLADAMDACPAPDVFFRDADGDGFGDPAVSIDACVAPPGYVLDSTDCDDMCSTCHPGFPLDVCGDGADNDCDGDVDGACACELLDLESGVYVVCPQELSWMDASAECVLLGGSLATLETALEHTDVLDGAAAIAAVTYWVDGTDEGHEGTWTWGDGTVYTECDPDCVCMGECAWGLRQPGFVFENCMSLHGDDGTWHNWTCDTLKPFICEL